MVAASPLRCTACGGRSLKHWAVVSNYHYVSCLSCGLIFLDRIPSEGELREFYNSVFKVEREIQQRRIRSHARSLLSLLQDCGAKNGRLLEIGCSFGYFLDEARRAGWQVEGVEISEATSAWARHHHEVPVSTGTVEAVSPRLRGQYDAIVSLHMLEHAPMPLRTLATIHRLLRDNGLLLLKTPNAASWLSRTLKTRWEWLNPPAHLFLFSPRAARAALQQSGFEAVMVTTQQGDAHNTLFQLLRGGTKGLLSIDAEFGPRIDRALGKSFWYRKIVRATDLLWTPFRPLEKALWSSSLLAPELLIVARKRSPKTFRPEVHVLAVKPEMSLRKRSLRRSDP